MDRGISFLNSIPETIKSNSFSFGLYLKVRQKKNVGPYVLNSIEDEVQNLAMTFSFRLRSSVKSVSHYSISFLVRYSSTRRLQQSFGRMRLVWSFITSSSTFLSEERGGSMEEKGSIREVVWSRHIGPFLPRVRHKFDSRETKEWAVAIRLSR